SLYAREERRIVSEYQRVFELEREVPVDRELDLELVQFHQEIERFEAQLQSQELKLEDLATIRARVRELLPRLTAAGRSAASGSGERRMPLATLSDEGYLAAMGGTSPESPLAAQEDLLGEFYRRLMDALREVDQEMPAERVVVLPEVFPLRIEPR